MVQDGRIVKLELPSKFDVASVEATPIKLPAKAKKRYSKDLNSAMLFAKYGLKILKIKASTLAELGTAVEESGVQAIGHGKVMLVSEHSEMAISRVNELIEEIQLSDKPNKHELIIDLMRLLREFNSQLLETAQVHFDANKELAGNNNKTPQLTMPFPAGQPLLISTMPPKPS